MKPGWWAIHREALAEYRRIWPQLLVTDLASRALGVVILTPVVSLLLKAFVSTTATGVVTDAGIVTFLLHPIGLVTLVIVGTVALGLLFAETGALMVIGFGALENRRVTWLEAYKYVFVGHLRRLWTLGGAVLIRLLLLSVPFLAGIAAVYRLLLGKFDINFYLSDKPPEFRVALAIAGVLVSALAVLVAWKIATWLFALPVVLFEGRGGKEALRVSADATTSVRPQIMSWLCGWVLGVFLLSTLATFLVGIVTSIVLPHEGTHIVWFVIRLGVVLILSGVANLAVTVFTTTMFPLIVAGLYRSKAGPGRLDPEPAAPGSLGEHPSFGIPGKAILWTGVATLIVLGTGFYLTLRELDWSIEAEIIAHRGGAAMAPENTMAAFEHAIEVGADWVELDVQENADGTVIVEHDSDFMRVAGVDLKVWDATDEDLKVIDVGSYFAPEFADQRAPTLREALERVKGHLGVFIELKYYGHDVELESRVVDIVESTEMVEDIVIMSLEYDKVRKTAALRPDWTYGLLNTVSIGDLTRLEVDFLALNASAATYSMIRRARRRGIKIYVWTVDDPVQMSVMMSRGVDGIITDKPGLARDVLELREDLTPFGRIIVWIAGETGLLQGLGKSSSREDA